MSEHRVTYGPYEPHPTIYVDRWIGCRMWERVPATARKRFETWRDEQGRAMGRWTWEVFSD